MADNMFLSDDFLKDTETEIEKKEQEFGGDKREKMSAGVYKLNVCKIETDTTTDGVPTVKVIMNVDLDQKTFRDVNKYFAFDFKSDKFEMNKKMFVEFFVKSFRHKFKAGDLKAVISQIKKYEGKKLSAVIQIKQKLMKNWVKDEKGKNTTELFGYMIIDMPQLYFVGQETETLVLKPEKKFVKLKASELEEYNDHKSEFADRYNEEGKLILNFDSPDATDEHEEHSQNDNSEPKANVTATPKPKSEPKLKEEKEEDIW